MIRRPLSRFRRLSQSARHLVLAVALALVVGSIVTSALTTASHPRRRAGSSSLQARSGLGKGARARRRPAPVDAVELARARRVVAHFLASYLAVAYGRAAPNSVTGVTPGLRVELVRERAQLTPDERQRRPRVQSLRVVGMTPGFVLATVTIADRGSPPTRCDSRLSVRTAAGR